MLCARHFFVVKYSLQMSPISLIAFCCGDKVGSLADVEFTLVWCGSLADSLLQLLFVLALV